MRIYSENWKNDSGKREKMTECIFCKIAAKKIPAKIIHEDDLAVAFEDINPQAPVHTLIIPKKHISTALDIVEGDHALIGHLFHVASQITKDKGIAKKGFRLVMNTNAEAGQSVFHIHLHLLGGRRSHRQADVEAAGSDYAMYIFLGITNTGFATSP
jgi:histidine triad (HIT) family protein